VLTVGHRNRGEVTARRAAQSVGCDPAPESGPKIHAIGSRLRDSNDAHRPASSRIVRHGPGRTGDESLARRGRRIVGPRHMFQSVHSRSGTIQRRLWRYWSR
jgi:hypothetical protein